PRTKSARVPRSTAAAGIGERSSLLSVPDVGTWKRCPGGGRSFKVPQKLTCVIPLRKGRLVQDFHDLWRRSSVAELSWITPGGPCGIPVVPLDDGGRPCAALPLSLLAEIDSLPGRAAFSVTLPGVADPCRPGQVA